MGTRTSPGCFDCLSKLAPDEPFFVLRGQDALAADLVREWALRARAAGCPADKTAEAERIADAMEAWTPRKDPD